MKVFHCLIKSKLGYSAAAWQGNIAECHKKKLDAAQNRGLRLITGQFKDTPLEALRAEARIPSYRTQIDRSLLISKEKALRQDEQHPRRRAFDDSLPKRLKSERNHNLASKTSQLAARHGLEVLSSSRKPLRYFELAPWLDDKLTNVFPHVPGLKSKDEDVLLRRALSYAAILALEADLVLYSDGSASNGTDKGGAGVVVTYGNAESPIVIDTLMKRGSILTSSYNEEHTAMHLALDWIDDNCLPEEVIAIVTDSKSLCDALHGYGSDTKMLRRRLLTSRAKVVVQWVPGHSGVEGNELADTAAKAATLLDEDPTEIPYGCARSLIKRSINDDISSHARSEEVYSKLSAKKEAEIKSREDQVLLARLRSGHHWGLESYHKLVNEEHDGRCKVCVDEPTHDLQHFICECEQTDTLRMECFGTTDIGLEVLTENPLAAIAFAREALRLRASNSLDAQAQA